MRGMQAILIAGIAVIAAAPMAALAQEKGPGLRPRSAEQMQDRAGVDEATAKDRAELKELREKAETVRERMRERAKADGAKDRTAGPQGRERSRERVREGLDGHSRLRAQLADPAVRERIRERLRENPELRRQLKARIRHHLRERRGDALGGERLDFERRGPRAELGMRHGRGMSRDGQFGRREFRDRDLRGHGRFERGPGRFGSFGSGRQGEFGFRGFEAPRGRPDFRGKPDFRGAPGLRGMRSPERDGRPMFRGPEPREFRGMPDRDERRGPAR
jgi:hypothetical protein